MGYNESESALILNQVPFIYTRHNLAHPGSESLPGSLFYYFTQSASIAPERKELIQDLCTPLSKSQLEMTQSFLLRNVPHS